MALSGIEDSIGLSNPKVFVLAPMTEAFKTLTHPGPAVPFVPIPPQESPFRILILQNQAGFWGKQARNA